MPNLRLTRENVREIRPPEKGEVFYWDTKLKGFGIRARPKSLVYIAQARFKTSKGFRTARVRIGRVDLLTTDLAEKHAKIALAALEQGKNPNEEEQARQRLDITLSELFEEYISIKKLRPKTIEVYRSAFRRCFPDWMNTRVVDITKDMVLKRHRDISNGNGPRGKGEAQANQSMRLLRSLLNYAAITYEDEQGRSLLPDNPVRRLSQTRTWNKIPRRQDVIPPEHLAAWYAAVMKLESDTMRDYLLLCLFTGFRRSEALKLTWKHINFDTRMIWIPAENTKADRDHAIPMSDFLFKLLLERSRRHVRRIDNNYVFPAREGSGHLIEPKRAIEKVISDSGVKFTMHTLRRTFETSAERLDISYYALKRLINHSLGNDVTSGYIVIDVERLRAPMQKITEFLKVHAGIHDEQKLTAQSPDVDSAGA